MSIMLPSELAHFLQMLGFDWPEGDEDKVFGYGQDWLTFAGRCSEICGNGQQSEQLALQNNSNDTMQAFTQRYNKEEGPTRVVADMAVGGNIGGAMLFAMGGLIIALKVVVIVQLVQFAITLAEAIAAAVPTCGASMSIVPIAELIAQKAIQFALNFAAQQLLG